MRNRILAAAPGLLLGLVRTLDRPDPLPMGTVELALHDEPAHLATSLLVLTGLAGPRWMDEHRAGTLTACAASMLIDIDHIPLFIKGFPIDVAVDNGRPFTHSFSTIAGLGALAVGARRHRMLIVATATGVGLHFVRDIATGRGLPLWWPFEHRNRRLPYAAYSAVLAGLAAVGTVRLSRWDVQASHGDESGDS